MNHTIFSFGHSSRAFSEFLQKLQEKNIHILVDVRTIPKSRFSPQYSQNAISQALTASGIQYIYRGKNLGGLGQNERYSEAIEELVELAKSGKNVCIMCSEADYMKCHRYTMLTPDFEERGIKVEHILYERVGSFASKNGTF